jgi:hypothetical protein
VLDIAWVLLGWKCVCSAVDMRKAANLAGWRVGSRLSIDPRVQLGEQQKTVGPIRPTVRGLW